MPLDLGRQRIVFVGGKGGVGKTTTAAALAIGFADAGERCLLVSTDPAHSLGDIFGTRIGNRERSLLPNLFALEIDPEEQVDRYLASVKRTMREFVRPEMYAEVDRQMSLNRLSPGAVEAAMMERMAEVMIDGEGSYDRIVFDTAPTGHTLRLLELPEIMAAWTDGLLRHRDQSDTLTRAMRRLRGGGRRGEDLSFLDPVEDDREDERSRRIREVLLERRRKFHRVKHFLLDAGTSAFVLVLIPERLPILETRKALDALERFEVPVTGMVVNRVLPKTPLGDFLEQRRGQEARYFEDIDRLFRGVPRVEVELQPQDVHGVEALRGIGRVLLA